MQSPFTAKVGRRMKAFAHISCISMAMKIKILRRSNRYSMESYDILSRFYSHLYHNMSKALCQMMAEVYNKVYHNTGPVYMGYLFSKVDQFYETTLALCSCIKPLV